MGITISHKLSQRKCYIKQNLDKAQKAAEFMQKEAEKLGIAFQIRRFSDFSLFIDIGGCETLTFEFKSVRELKEEKEKTGYSYLYSTLTDDGKKTLDEGYMIDKYPKNEIYYCSDFCKTQFCKDLWEHKTVADLIKIVACHCLTADVYDEGEYYHSGVLDNAGEAIKENGKLIDSITGMLTNVGWKNDEIIKAPNIK